MPEPLLAAPRLTGRLVIPILAVVGHLVFSGSVLYFLAFVAGLAPIRTVDAPLAGFSAGALAIDVGLVLLFGLQHSVMARPGFKRVWQRWCPPALERTIYVLAASAALALLCLAWRPLSGAVWDVSSPPLRMLGWAGFGAGAVLLFAAAGQIDLFALTGVRQAFEHAGWLAPRTDGGLVVRGLYRWTRHPIASGWLLVLWVTPTMTVGHLLLAVAMTVYILIGTWLEERALVASFGDLYRRYRRSTGAFWPRLIRRGGAL